jgi:hypothetical protein
MTLFDSTEKRIVLSNVPFPYADANYSSTPIDGFKILKGTMEYDTRVKNIILTPNESVWFEMPNSNLGSQIHPGSDLGLLYRPPSSIKRGRYHSIEVRFSSKTGYTDLNQNGRYDLMEPYFVDSVNANATQRAFFYKKKVYSSQPGLFKGFRPIPFTVFDVETIPHRQLNVVIDDYYNTQWDLTDLYTISYSYPDYTYIFDTSYDSTGVMYDSTKGGINLLPNLNNRTPIPCQWLLQLATRNHIEPYSYPVTLKITPTYPISSQTEIVFNPTNVVGIDKEIVPSEFKLFQNYPNPFNPTTAISYTLSAVRDVSLKVFDVLGREIVTLVNERQEEGEYTVKWDAAEFSSGVYFYQLRAGEFVQTKKMVIVR